MADLVLQVGESRVARVSFLAADGSETSVEAGTIQWSSNFPELVSLGPHEDPASQVVTAVAIGDAIITVSGDADPGGAGRIISTTSSIQVIAAIAAKAVMAFH